MSLRTRLPGSALAVLAGASLFLASFASPVGQRIVEAFPPPVDAISTPTSVPVPDSVRMLAYDNATDRLRGMRSYATVRAAMPKGGHLQYVMGSSEFSVPLAQNPIRFLPNSTTDFDLFVSGRAFTNVYVHALELAAMPPGQRPGSVVLLVSPQWFSRVGISDALNAAFSDQQWKALLDRTTLPPSLKKKMVDRGQDLLMEGTWKQAPPTSAIDHLEAGLGAPGRRFSQHAAVLRGVARERSQLDLYPKPYAVAPGAVPAASLDWAAAHRQAERDAVQASSGNPFGFDQQAWETNYASKVAEMKGSMSNIDFSRRTQEWSDLQLFLDVAKAQHVKVLLVGLPMNGAWYDYTGYPSSRRVHYYERLADVAQRNKVSLVDLSTKEYTPHFFYDGLHLGWEGWLDVTEICYRYSTTGRA